MKRRQFMESVVVTGVGASIPYILTGCEPGSSVARRASRGEQSASAASESDVLVPAHVPLIEALTFRRSDERGHAERDWLRTKHTFSFARYQDPAHMSFRSLRVMNEDVIAGGGGFPMHPHRDMEILTYVLDGALEHKDSMGNGSVIRPGEVQAMSAGTGVKHSEFNPSQSNGVHLLQIWLFPDARNHQPSYAQRVIEPHTSDEPVRLIASPDGADGSVVLHQNARIHAVKLKKGEEAYFEVFPSRHAWVQLARGGVTLNRDHTLHQGDGVSTSQHGGLHFSAASDSEFLIFDLA